MQLSINNISKKYGKNKALEDICFELEDGVYGILGANGAGKTTLMNILIGVVSQSSGEILYQGKDIRQLGTNYLELVGYMPQYPKFYPNFKVDEFLEYMCTIKGIKRKEIKKRVENVLADVNLIQHRYKKIKELSGGMRQRVGIAQAILNNPKLLVLDEPTAGLDPAERIRFRNIISKIAKDRIVLIATHIVSDIEFIANEVIIMKAGRLIKKGTIEELCDSEQGNVWETEMPDNEIETIMNNHLVSNIRRDSNSVCLRVICNTRPKEANFKVVNPHLEDVFLDIFNNVEV